MDMKRKKSESTSDEIKTKSRPQSVWGSRRSSRGVNR